ncbi:alpha/beta hydrolase [Roseateles cellulosilyticus]|uniref:Enterochelin esterase n=1 Tax=Pelomonas cellulosilytica TaxID=2906762 RepID=A0ABS8Y3C0_9BURK|nr:alpha/beta hydrolase-fold protein [Pelomonas sp. P8]MCE4557526.1 hypothetical protein [Pelomonas sp. P8]
MKRILIGSAWLLAGLGMVSAALAQEQVTPDRARANFARTIELAADDVRHFPPPPAGFRDERSGISHGRPETMGYDSVVTGTRREALVYLPPGYSRDRKYPVLYLLHGIGGNPHEWTGYVRAPIVLDNLLADGKVQPMIVVFPNGRALADDRAPPADRVFTAENAAGFAKFERDLLESLIPAVQASYPTETDRKHRALAGLSMGGGQSLNFGLGHLDTFAWLGGFSSAPNTKPAAELLADPEGSLGRQPAFVYLSCGRKDGLISVSQAVHRHLKAHGVAHVWHVDEYGHDGDSWAENLYYFAQQLFR